MAAGPVVLPKSGHAAWDDLATWWSSRYMVSTQQTYATYLPRWTAWCTRHGLRPLHAGRADVERWLRSIADSGLSQASVAGHYGRGGQHLPAGIGGGPRRGQSLCAYRLADRGAAGRSHPPSRRGSAPLDGRAARPASSPAPREPRLT
jgi:hypothetical protein